MPLDIASLKERFKANYRCDFFPKMGDLPSSLGPSLCLSLSLLLKFAIIKEPRESQWELTACSLCVSPGWKLLGGDRCGK